MHVVLHVEASVLLFCKQTHDFGTLYHDIWGCFFQRIRWQRSPQRVRGWWSTLPFGVASMGTLCELFEEHLFASDDDEEDHNTWNVLLDLITRKARIQSSLADEELGQVGPSCHHAMDCLCAELYALWGLLDHDWHRFGLLRRVQASAWTVFSHEETARFFFFEYTKKCRFLVNCICAPCHWLPTPRTRDVRAWRGGRLHPNAAMKQFACAPTFQRATSKTLQVELQRTLQPMSANQKRATNRRNQKPLLQKNEERTNRNTADTMEGPETTTIAPRARDKQHIWRRTVFVRIADLQSCWAATNAKITDELAKKQQNHNIPLFLSKNPQHTTSEHPCAAGNSKSTPLRPAQQVSSRLTTNRWSCVDDELSPSLWMVSNCVDAMCFPLSALSIRVMWRAFLVSVFFSAMATNGVPALISTLSSECQAKCLAQFSNESIEDRSGLSIRFEERLHMGCVIFKDRCSAFFSHVGLGSLTRALFWCTQRMHARYTDALNEVFPFVPSSECFWVFNLQAQWKWMQGSDLESGSSKSTDGRTRKTMNYVFSWRLVAKMACKSFAVLGYWAKTESNHLAACFLRDRSRWTALSDEANRLIFKLQLGKNQWLFWWTLGADDSSTCANHLASSQPRIGPGAEVFCSILSSAGELIWQCSAWIVFSKNQKIMHEFMNWLNNCFF